MADRRNMDSKFRDSHITGKHLSSEDKSDEGEYFDVAVLESKPMQQTRVSVALVTMAAAKCDMHSIQS